jgi:hypothetical protein
VRRGVLPLALLVLGCAPKPAPPIHPDEEACRLYADAPRRLDTVTVALPENGGAKNAVTTLVRLDCGGHARPGLADSWSKDAAGRTWTIIVKEDARTEDGLRLTAQRIASTWAERGLVGASGILDSVVPVDDRTLAVTLRQVQDSAPSILADPAFSLAVAAEQRRIRVELEQLNQEDPRDALERGADIVVTRDPTVLEYVAARPEFVRFSLPWSRTYVLFESASHSDSLNGILADPQAGRSLADAAGVDARMAEPPFWWSDLSACRRNNVAVSRQQSPRVVYAEGDEVARRLAERVVALTPSGTGVTAAALGPAQLTAAVQRGSDKAYVLAVPRRSLVPCRDSSGWPPAASIHPLIDSRAFAIVRRGSPPITVDWDGSIRIEDAVDDHAP